VDKYIFFFTSAERFKDKQRGS